MRRVRYFPMIVVGLAGFASQTALLTQCRAWDNAPSAAVEDPAYSSPMNAQPADGRYVDPAVQQAGYYDSRPRPSSAGAGIQPSAANRNGALFRGQKVKMPNLPFGRPTASSKTMARVPQSNAPMAAQNNAALAQSRAATQAPPTGRVMQQRMPAGAPLAANGNRPTPRIADARPPQPIRQDYVPHPTARPNVAAPATPAIPNTTSVSPWSQQTPAAAAPVSPAGPTLKPAAAALPAKPAGPLTTADRLVAEAHEMSNSAQCEEDYTHIIETCRRAQASQASPTTAQFAKNLISWSLNRRGQLKAEGGQDKEAILDFDDAIRTDGTCWRALHNRGVMLAQAGQFEKAFDDFTHTIQLNPEFAKVYSNRAALYMVADNLKSALDDYNRAIELDPNLAVAHRGCGRVCQLMGHVDEAVGHYDAAVQLAPNDAYAAACRADLLTDVGRYADAVHEYERAIEIDPSSSQAQGGSAWLLATCPDSAVRNPELAIERAQTVIEQGGDKEAVNYDTLAAAEAAAGDFSAAMDAVRQAIELAPKDECEAYKDRLVMYQQAKPYRIAPIERAAKQVNYETPVDVAGVAR